MNLPTVIVLIVLVLCVALALRSIFGKKKGGHCGGCSNESCGGGKASDPKACPSVQRALADVDAKLGEASDPETPHGEDAPR